MNGLWEMDTRFEKNIQLVNSVIDYKVKTV